MAKLDKLKTRGGRSQIVSVADPGARTFEGAPGFSRDVKGELFLLGVTNLVSEDTFYEAAAERDDRYVQLIRAATREDADWVARFLPWLRGTANLRTASLVGAVEYAIARATVSDGPTGRSVVASVCQRADEPAEVLAYYVATHGRKIPKAIKRGVADAAQRLYNERSFLKYGDGSRNWKFADVIELTHPTPESDAQSALFKYAIDSRHRATPVPEELRVVNKRARIDTLSDTERRSLSSQELRAAGVTWENASSWGAMDKDAWEQSIPNMGYMALLRNLRNFDEKGVSDSVAMKVMAKLADPSEVAKSRQLPLRFLSAYKEAPSLRWAWPLEQALNASLSNVPQLKGDTLLLLDKSGSMADRISDKSKVTRYDVAAVFAAAIALRAESIFMLTFNNYIQAPPIELGASVLKVVESFGRPSGGTYLHAAVRQGLSQVPSPRRVVILTDEQVYPDTGSQSWYESEQPIGRIVPAHVPVYIFNVAGYKHGAMATGTPGRHVFGGLTDACFSLIPLLERGADGDWPF